MSNRLFKSEHKRVADMLSAYIDGELSPKEQATVEKHLARCADCAHNLHTLRQTVVLLRELPPVAVPRSFAIRPVQAARRPSFFQTRRAYVFLRAATALATVLLVVVLAGDVFITGLAPYLAPARAPAVIVREVPVEKMVIETVVVEKEAVVEKEVPVTVEVEKEAAVEVEKEVVVEKASAYEATPVPAPAEKKDEWALTQKPLPTPAAVGTEIAPGAAPLFTPERGALAEVPLPPEEERIEGMAISTTLPAEAIITPEPVFTPTAMPTAVAEVLPSTPLTHEPTVRAAVHPGRSGLVLVRVVEVSLLSLVLVLVIATLVVKRRQGAI